MDKNPVARLQPRRFFARSRQVAPWCVPLAFFIGALFRIFGNPPDAHPPDRPDATSGFYVADSNPAEGAKEARVEASGAKIYLLGSPVLTDRDVAKAAPGFDPELGLEVDVEFTKEGAAKLGKATEENIGKQIAVVVEGKVVFSAQIVSRFSDRARITGQFTREEVEKISRAIDPKIAKAEADNLAAARDSKTDDGRLKYLRLAFQSYRAAHKRLPDVAIRDRDRKPLLSWRVAILPYIDGGAELYRRFHLDEPWDSEQNRTLIEKIPNVFRSDQTDAGQTRFLAPVGERVAFAPGGPGRNLDDFTDPTASTILLVEADKAHAVVWTRPEELVIDLEDPKRGITDGETSFWILMGGSVHLLKGSIRPGLLRALLTVDGGDRVDHAEFKRSELADVAVFH